MSSTSLDVSALGRSDQSTPKPTTRPLVGTGATLLLVNAFMKTNPDLTEIGSVRVRNDQYLTGDPVIVYTVVEAGDVETT